MQSPPDILQQPGTRALVVDDDPDAALVLAKLLRATLSWDVRIAHDAASALAMLDKVKPRIAFLDILMPEMDGLELARTLRRTPGFEGIPLIAVSSLDTAELATDVVAAGFNVRLVKPAMMETLASALQRLRS